jgi:hypothetical protein
MERENLFEVDSYGFMSSRNNSTTTNSTIGNNSSGNNQNSNNVNEGLHREHPLLSSSDSLPTTSLASYSVPGSRRNSTDAEDAAFVEAFDSKLKLHQQDSLGFLASPHRSMSIDEAALKQKLAVGSITAETADPHGTQRLLFDSDTGKGYYNATHIYTHQLTLLPFQIRQDFLKVILTYNATMDPPIL